MFILFFGNLHHQKMRMNAIFYCVKDQRSCKYAVDRDPAFVGDFMDVFGDSQCNTECKQFQIWT